MWQKPAKAILEAQEAFRNIIGFIFFCVFSGMLGALLWECISKKAGWADQLSFALLAISMSVFYGFHIYGIIAARQQTKNFRLQRFMLCLKLIFYLVSFLVGIIIVSRISVG
jgi:MFS-type transporter involved in bile tolerance (Atg22 family)